MITINTILLDDSLEGSKMIDLGQNRACMCFVVPRDKIKSVAEQHKQFTSSAFYLLLGSGNGLLPDVYVGKTDNFLRRSADHARNKQFWDTAMVFVSKTNELYGDEISYLEYLGYEAVQKSPLHTVINCNKVKEPKVPYVKAQQMREFFEDIKLITKFCSCDAFDDNVLNEISPYETYFLDMPDEGIHAEIRYFLSSKRYLLVEGSLISAEEKKSCRDSVKIMRQNLLGSKNVICEEGRTYKITKSVYIDVPSGKPSKVAQFITGASTNGSRALLDKNKISFGEKHPELSSSSKNK